MLVVLAVGPNGSAIELSWDAPAECPSEADVRARVRARSSDRGDTRIEAEAVVERGPERPDEWRLHLWVRSEDTVAERTLTGHSCEALADATATMLAVAATPESEPPPTTTEIPAPTPLPAATPSTAEAPAAGSAPRASPAIDVIAADSAPPRPTTIPRPLGRVAVAGGLDYASVPGLGGALAVEAGLYWPRLRVHATAVHGISRRVSAADVAARHRVTAGGLGLCGVAPLRAFELGACTGVEVGAMHSRGIRGRALEPRRTTWAAVTAGGLAGWRFASRWSLVLRADVVVPLLRRGFFIGDTLVGRTGEVGVRALLGFAVVFP